MFDNCSTDIVAYITLCRAHIHIQLERAVDSFGFVYIYFFISLLCIAQNVRSKLFRPEITECALVRKSHTHTFNYGFFALMSHLVFSDAHGRGVQCALCSLNEISVSSTQSTIAQRVEMLCRADCCGQYGNDFAFIDYFIQSRYFFSLFVLECFFFIVIL